MGGAGHFVTWRATLAMLVRRLFSGSDAKNLASGGQKLRKSVFLRAQSAGSRTAIASRNASTRHFSRPGFLQRQTTDPTTRKKRRFPQFLSTTARIFGIAQQNPHFSRRCVENERSRSRARRSIRRHGFSVVGHVLAEQPLHDRVARSPRGARHRVHRFLHHVAKSFRLAFATRLAPGGMPVVMPLACNAAAGRARPCAPCHQRPFIAFSHSAPTLHPCQHRRHRLRWRLGARRPSRDRPSR